MEWIFGQKRSKGSSVLLVGKVKGRRGAEGNMVSVYQDSLFSKCTFLALYLLMTKCSAFLIPITSTEIANNQLCPNPVDWQEPFTSLFPYRFFPNNVVVMDLVRGAANVNTSSAVPCHFRIGGPDTGIKAGHATLISLQQRPRPISFLQKCSRVLEFPGRWGEEESPIMNCAVAPDDPNPAELNLNIRIMGQVKWGTGGKLQFELPYQSTSAPYLIALFKVTTQIGNCELQIQQYFWSKGNDSWSCARDLKRKLLNNVCGRIPCSKQQAILHELKGFSVKEPLLVDAVDDLGLSPDVRIRTIGYFLKGLLLPLIISLSATMAYIIWRRRMKASANGMEGVSLGTQTGQSSGREEEGVLIHFEEYEEDYAKDKPPTYDSLLEPPSYEQATSPLPPLSPSHLLEMEIDMERQLLLKTPPLENDIVEADEDNTTVLTPTRSPQGHSSIGCYREEQVSPLEETEPLPPPPPFQ